MYLRRTQRRKKNGDVVAYYQLAESRWSAERQRSEVQIVHNFGRADKLDADALRRLVRSIQRVLAPDVEVPPDVDVEAIELEASRPIGGVHVIRALWEELGIGPTLRKYQASRLDAAPHETALFAMVANRLLEPSSKLACYEHWVPDSVYLPAAEGLTLDQFYFAMDFLKENIAAVEESVFFHTANLFNVDVDVVFWDTTSVYFEIEEDDEGNWPFRSEFPERPRKRGHSKDNREDRPQVVIGLAVTRDGLPVRSWVFPGNTVDVNTVKTIREGLRGWRLGRCIWVGDAGMYSEKNLETLTKGLGRYIVAVPAATLKEVKDQVLGAPGRFRRVDDSLDVKEVVVGDGARRRRYVLCRNRAEETRQRERRKELLKGLELELAGLSQSEAHTRRKCSLLSSKRYGRYLTEQKNGKLRIDQKKVKRVARGDGRTVLLTNDDTLRVEDVAYGYKSMRIIESCFRRMKTTGLRIRPVYHWVPHRIESHVKLCVLALLIQRAVEIRTGETWRAVRHELQQIEAVRYRIERRTIVQATRIRPKGREFLKKLGVAPPKRVLDVAEATADA
jgi:transposase